MFAFESKKLSAICFDRFVVLETFENRRCNFKLTNAKGGGQILSTSLSGNSKRLVASGSKPSLALTVIPPLGFVTCTAGGNNESPSPAPTLRKVLYWSPSSATD